MGKEDRDRHERIIALIMWYADLKVGQLLVWKWIWADYDSQAHGPHRSK